MDLGIGRVVGIDEIREVLSGLFPAITVCVTDDPELRSVPSNDVLIQVLSNPSEFPTGLAVSARMLPGFEFEDWLRDFAQALSTRLHTRTICDGTPYGDTPAPYWSLVWDNGTPFLASDLDSEYADGKGGPVRIVRPLELSLFTSPRPPLAHRVLHLSV